MWRWGPPVDREETLSPPPVCGGDEQQVEMDGGQSKRHISYRSSIGISIGLSNSAYKTLATLSTMYALRHY